MVRSLVTLLPFLLPLLRGTTQSEGGRRYAGALADAAAPRRPQDGGGGNKVLLSSVQSLTFAEDDATRSRIGQPVPKLSCSGGDCLGTTPGGGDHRSGGAPAGHISQALCQNMGADDTGRPSWRCTASLPKGCKFTKTEVSCESWSGRPDDEYVAPGSCALSYETVCGRTEEAQREESELRRKVKSERGRQQDATLAEVERQRGQAAKDECELKIAGALYPVGQEVEVNENAAHGGSGRGRSGEEASWIRGYVGHIDCDGTYRVDFWTSWRKSLHNVRESNLRVAVDPIYLQEDVRSSASYSFRNDMRYSKARPNQERPPRHNEPVQIATGTFLKIAACGLLLFFIILYFGCKCCCKMFKPTLSASAIAKCLYDSPGHRLQMRDIRDKFRAAIDHENSQGPNGCGDEKLWQILTDVAVEDGYEDTAGRPPAGVPRGDDMFFRLKPEHVAFEQEKEKERIERERRAQERRDRERRDRDGRAYGRGEQYRDMPGRDGRYGQDRNRYGQGGNYQRRHEQDGRHGQDWRDQGRYDQGRRNQGSYAQDRHEQDRRYEQERYEQDRRDQDMRQRRANDRPESQGRSNAGTTAGARLDEAAMERQREAKTKILAAQAELRVARVKAKQDQAEAARIQEYQTQIEQMQRDVENDTSQLGNVMRRFDALMEEYEAVGVSSTKLR